MRLALKLREGGLSKPLSGLRGLVETWDFGIISAQLLLQLLRGV